MPAPTDRSLDAITRRVVAGLGGAGATVSLGSGAVLAARYEPGQLGWLRALHAGGAAMTLMSLIAAWALRRRGAVRLTPGAAFGVLAVVLVLGSAFATGPHLAWDEAAPGERGMFVDGPVVADGQLVPADEVAEAFVLHAVLGACSFALIGVGYLRSRWRPRPSDPPRRRRPPAPSSGSSGSAATT